MYDRGDTKPTSSPSKAAPVERREANRHPFIAAADVIDIASGTRFSTRTTDLGPGGCFVDTLVPFEAGSKVRVSIREGQTRFEATGLVVYSQAGLGMGIAFDTLRPDQRRSLAVWLGEEVDLHQQTVEASVEPRPNVGAGLPHGSDREAFLRLIKALIAKGILSESEAAAIYSNPVMF
jgi:PilZ domain-containing protein